MYPQYIRTGNVLWVQDVYIVGGCHPQHIRTHNIYTIDKVQYMHPQYVSTIYTHPQYVIHNTYPQYVKMYPQHLHRMDTCTRYTHSPTTHTLYPQYIRTSCGARVLSGFMYCGQQGIYCGQPHVYIVDNTVEYIVDNLLWVQDVYIVERTDVYVVGDPQHM